MEFLSWLVVMTVSVSVAISLNSYNFSLPSGRPVSKVLYVTGLLYALVAYLILTINSVAFFSDISHSPAAFVGVVVGVALGTFLGLCLEGVVFTRLLRRNRDSLTNGC